MGFSFDILFKNVGFSKTVKEVENMQKTVSSINKNIEQQATLVKEVEKASKTLGVAFARIHPTLGKTHNFLSNLTSEFSNLQKDAMIFGKAIRQNFFSIIVPLTLITGAILTLRRMFQLNIGGMATYFYSIVGKIRVVWYKFMRAFDNLLRENADIFQEIFQVIYDAIIPVLNAMMAIIKWFNDLPKPIRKAIIVVGLFAAGIFTIAAAFTAATLAYTAFSAATGGLAWSIGVIVTAIVALVVALYELVKHWDWVKQKLGFGGDINATIDHNVGTSNSGTGINRISNNNITIHTTAGFDEKNSNNVASLLARHLDT